MNDGGNPEKGARGRHGPDTWPVTAATPPRRAASAARRCLQLVQHTAARIYIPGRVPVGGGGRLAG